KCKPDIGRAASILDLFCPGDACCHHHDGTLLSARSAPFPSCQEPSLRIRHHLHRHGSFPYFPCISTSPPSSSSFSTLRSCSCLPGLLPSARTAGRASSRSPYSFWCLAWRCSICGG